MVRGARQQLVRSTNKQCKKCSTPARCQTSRTATRQRLFPHPLASAAAQCLTLLHFRSLCRSQKSQMVWQLISHLMVIGLRLQRAVTALIRDHQTPCNHLLEVVLRATSQRPTRRATRRSPAARMQARTRARCFSPCIPAFIVCPVHTRHQRVSCGSKPQTGLSCPKNRPHVTSVDFMTARYRGCRWRTGAR